MTVVGVRAAHMHDARKRVERRLAKVGGGCQTRRSSNWSTTCSCLTDGIGA